MINDEYLAYLLRFKRSPERSNWRASLENAHTGTVHHFASKEELFLYLMDRLNGSSSPMRLDDGVDTGPR